MLNNITSIDGKLLAQFIPDYQARFTIRGLISTAGINYPHGYSRIKYLAQNQILKQNKTIHSNEITLILNTQSIGILSMIEPNTIMIPKTLTGLIEKISATDPFACIGIFGSRALKIQDSGSDWDIFVITQMPKAIQKTCKKALILDEKLNIIPITSEEFLDSQKTSEENLAKHILRKKIILHNPFPFYNMARQWELIKNGPIKTTHNRKIPKTTESRSNKGA